MCMVSWGDTRSTSEGFKGCSVSITTDAASLFHALVILSNNNKKNVSEMFSDFVGGHSYVRHM